MRIGMTVERLLWMTVTTLFIASSCGRAADTETRTASNRAATATGPKAVVEQVVMPALVEPDGEYRVAGKRDPFQPPSSVGSGPSPSARPGAEQRLCERTPVTQIDRLDARVEAIVRPEGEGAAPLAVLAGPERRGYIIGEGAVVTRDCAIVTKILPDRIVLSVPHRDASGNLKPIEDMIPLRLAGPVDDVQAVVQTP